MKRIIGFAVLTAVTLYMSLIYNSDSFLLLFYMEIVFGITMSLFVYPAAKKTKVLLKVNSNMIYLNDAVNIDIDIKHKSRIPIGAFRVNLKCVNLYTGKKRNIILRGDTGGIRVKYKPDATGYYEFMISRAYVYDYLGILLFPIKDIDRHTENAIVVSELYDANVYINNGSVGGSVQEMGSKERYNITAGEIGSIRNYNPGDSLRNIHWKLTSKMDDIMVKEEDTMYKDIFVFFLIFSDKKGNASALPLQELLKQFLMAPCYCIRNFPSHNKKGNASALPLQELLKQFLMVPCYCIRSFLSHNKKGNASALPLQELLKQFLMALHYCIRNFLSHNKKGKNMFYESFLQTMASLSNSLIKNGGQHYISWYDSTEENIVRYKINAYEDISGVMETLAKSFFVAEKVTEDVDIYSLLQLYEKQYDANPADNYMSLDMQLDLNVNNEYIAHISQDSLKESLSQVEIII